MGIFPLKKTIIFWNSRSQKKHKQLSYSDDKIDIKVKRESNKDKQEQREIHRETAKEITKREGVRGECRKKQRKLFVEDKSKTATACIVSISQPLCLCVCVCVSPGTSALMKGALHWLGEWTRMPAIHFALAVCNVSSPLSNNWKTHWV